MRTTKEARREYFANFLQNRPQGKLDEYHIRLIGRDSLGLPNAVRTHGVCVSNKPSGTLQLLSALRISHVP